MPHGGGEGDFAWPESATRFEQQIPSAEVEAARPDVRRVRLSLAHVNEGTLLHSVLLDDDGVGTFGHWGASEDPHSLSCPDSAAVRMPGRRLANYPELRGKGGNVGRADRVAIHGGGIEGGLRQARGEGGGQNAPSSLFDGHGFGRGRLDTVQDLLHRLCD
jgi:hypothetical protein